MLVVKRRERERVQLRVGDVTWLLVVGFERVTGDRPRVLVGIDAPPEVTVLREELLAETEGDR